MKVQYYDTQHSCAIALATGLASALQKRLQEAPRASLALSGGRSPRQVLPFLARMDVHWASVDATLTDDRCVPMSNPDSNARLIQEYFLAQCATDVRFVPLWGEMDQPENMPRAVDAATARLSNVSWPPDVVYLGMGEDGHFASLFPAGHLSTFGERDAVCVVGMASQAPHQRISLSLPVLLSSRHIFLHVTNSAKIETLNAALSSPPTPELPISLLVHAEHPSLDILCVP